MMSLKKKLENISILKADEQKTGKQYFDEKLVT